MVEGAAIRCSSAAAAVTIVNTEPGGCGAETARPASAPTAPSRGRMTATPPSRSPRAAVAARVRLGSIVVRTGRPRRAARACGRAPAPRSAAARPDGPPAGPRTSVEFSDRYQTAMDALRTPRVKTIEDTISQTARRTLGFLGSAALADIDVRFGFADSAKPFRTLRLNYRESGLELPADELGSGVQSAIVVGIFEAFRQFGATVGTVLIEEPEMYCIRRPSATSRGSCASSPTVTRRDPLDAFACLRRPAAFRGAAPDSPRRERSVRRGSSAHALLRRSAGARSTSSAKAPIANRPPCHGVATRWAVEFPAHHRYGLAPEGDRPRGRGRSVLLIVPSEGLRGAARDVRLRPSVRERCAERDPLASGRTKRA